MDDQPAAAPSTPGPGPHRGMSDFAEARARKALSDAGLDYTMPLTRASSVTNEVWLTEGYAIRVNRKPNQRLRREAFLGPLLPGRRALPRGHRVRRSSSVPTG